MSRVPARPRRRRSPPKAPAVAARPPVEITIERLGGRGDGIGRIGAEPAYVAGALPGERVLATPIARRGEGWEARLERVIDAAPERRTPPCPHFGLCGGCTLQHIEDSAYRAFKRERIATALQRAGLGDVEIRAPIVTPPSTRRRLTFAARLTGGRVELGFNEAASHRIVDLADCSIAEPRLLALLPPLRALVTSLGRSSLDLSLLGVGTGIDLLIRAGDALSLAELERLARFAQEQDLARIAWQIGDSEAAVIAARRPVQALFAGVAVELPPGAFLQATLEGEQAITTAVLDRLGDAPPGVIADCFAGCGTLTLPLAKSGRTLHALDGDAAGIAALQRAAHRAGLPVTSEVRDLERRPPGAVELQRYAALLFDPPRAGAAALSAALAASKLPLLVAVSCNPDSFARDARTLVAGGYRLGPVQPIDQFLWSSHVELVAAFRR